MKKILLFVLICALLMGCVPLQAFATEEETDIPDFQGLDDPALLQYVEDNLYATLEGEFASDDYIIEDITAVYKSKEYMEELAYNSQENIFFGHTLAESEIYVLEKYGGKEQISFLNGEEVAYATPHATRPDIVREIGNHLEAIEVKNYNLENPQNVANLCNKLKQQVGDRVTNMPDGTLQRVVLDVRERDFSTGLLNDVVLKIQQACSSSYTDLPVDILAA